MLKPYDRPVGNNTDDVRSEFTEASTSSDSLKHKKPRAALKKRVKKLFVLDTNVLMHDPSSLFRFEEHDVYLPIGTLEELDNHKKGLSDVSRNARQASRFLDEIVSSAVGGAAGDISKGIPLTARAGERRAAGFSCRPKPSRATCPRRCRWARRTTRSSPS